MDIIAHADFVEVLSYFNHTFVITQIRVSGCHLKCEYNSVIELIGIYVIE